VFVLARTVTYATLFVGFWLVFLPARLLSWAGLRAPAHAGVPQVLGLVLAAAGALLAVSCILAFAFVGRGTPAPFDPPRRLVIAGPYRFVRNPMYAGAVALLLGAALTWEAPPLLAYALLFLAGAHLFVLGFEEPTLRRRFGAEYEAYCRHVGRWWPRGGTRRGAAPERAPEALAPASSVHETAAPVAPGSPHGEPPDSLFRSSSTVHEPGSRAANQEEIVMKRTGQVYAALIAALVLLSGVTGDALAKEKKPKPAKPEAGAKPDAGAKPEAPKGGGDEKPFDEVVKDMTVTKGLFTFYRRADDGKVLIEILPDQLDKTFLFAGTLDQSVGERGFYGAMQLGDFPFVFHQAGKSVQLVMRNPSFSAPPGSPAARAIARSFPGALMAMAKVQSKPHPDRKSVLIDLSELLVKDLPGFAPQLTQAYQPTNYSFDKDKSAIRDVKGFPENALIEVGLHYQTDNPRTFSITLPDARSIPMVVKYEVSSLKQTGYKPREADDRVGHFLTIHQDYTSDRPASPYVRYITRWNLEKSDPSAALSPPKQPIVFWLENTIPVEYRDAIRDGTLLWNKAFERLGFKDAVVVKQQPDDADWDPADTRYNTIRWFAGVDATFAIGPSRADPFTGQIYDADIGISEGIIRNARRLGEEYVSPVALSIEEPAPMLASAWARNLRGDCAYASGLAQQAAFGMEVLEARGALSPEVEAKLMNQYIVELTAHEVGHTLGLRHNFRASAILDPGDLNNTAKTSQIGQSSSVMDYNPVIVAGKGQIQGDFVPTTLGPYDYWAIEYAYKPIAGDEKEELAKIASRCADPMVPYSTDEDALGTYSPASIDPLANQYDASDDPLAYFKGRVALVNELWSGMEKRLGKPGEGYQVFRRALSRGLSDDFRSLVTSSKLIGGIYHHRDHVGDPGGRLPYEPVPAAKQREALDFLSTAAFGSRSFQLPASVLNRLAIERNPGLDFATYFNAPRIDYPWHDAVLNLQRNVLNRLYNSITLARIQDNELRFAPSEKPFRMADMFSGVSGAIWSELDSPGAEITSLRRNLQREHLKQLIRLALRQGAAPAVVAPGGPGPGAGQAAGPLPPEDATTLARASLVRIQGKIRADLLSKGLTDATTRAHLQETDARITAALAARLDRNLE
jgi:protein-S-isoprenylcysteine O-methyltransferase Ste14